MSILHSLPDNVIGLISTASIAEFTTISAAGVPIDTTSLYFPNEAFTSIDLATGLAYPAKADRARRNPKVGLLIEGGARDPVVFIAGQAAVRDADLQANVVRYLSESGYSVVGGSDWTAAQKAIWYWARIFIDIAPAHVLWWESPAAMDRAPQRLDAPADTKFPVSDPAPEGTPSQPPKWQELPWPDLAGRAFSRHVPAHLSLIDHDGYPLPIRAANVKQTAEGFTMTIPKGIPWSAAAKASFTFQGIETFIGEVTSREGLYVFRVERCLPIHPLMSDFRVVDPLPYNKEKLMERLEKEAARRKQPIPVAPMQRPAPTHHYKLRMARNGTPWVAP